MKNGRGKKYLRKLKNLEKKEKPRQKWVSDKNHITLFCAELGGFGLSSIGMNMPKRRLFSRVSGSAIPRL